MRLKGKTVIVTGAGGGLGSATALLAAQEGAEVVVADINMEAADKTVETIRSEGGRAEAQYVDIGDEAAIKAMYDTVVERSGKVDAVVNNAAALNLVAEDRGIEDMDAHLWDETMRFDLRGTMLSCKHAIPIMRRNGGGSIVNISSAAGLAGARNFSAYAAAKAGVVALSRSVATQHGAEGIRCNTIAPGVIMTTGTEVAYAPMAAEILPLHLSTRLGKPMDIAWAVFWLIADEAAYVNGQCISVDGGILIHQSPVMDAGAG